MGMPATIRVKLSSEAAGAISITPVVVQEMAARDLMEQILGVAGKDEERLRHILRVGSLVSGGTRFRWERVEAEDEELRALLRTFPDPDPSRPFAATDCVKVVLRGGRQAIEITREAGSRKALLQRDTFWDAMMRVFGTAKPEYAGYSYREQADRYTHVLTSEEIAAIRSAGPLLRYTSLTEQVRSQPFTHAEMHTKR
jgi:hypothetical protein